MGKNSENGLRPPTRVVVAEADPVFRAVLHTCIEKAAGMKVIASVDNGPDAVRVAEETNPDVVLISAELGAQREGVRAARMIKAASPATGIVILSVREDGQLLASLPDRKAAGWSFLLKQSVGDGASLLRAIEGAAWGLVTVDPAMMDRLRPRRRSILERLTQTQLAVLKAMASGYNDPAIAVRLRMAEEQVTEVSATVYQDLHIEPEHGLDQRVKAALIFLRETSEGTRV